MNKKRNLIFLGKSASGKGTQIKFLKNHFAQKNEELVFLSIGAGLRKISQETGYVAGLIKKVQESGNLVPEVVATTVWSTFLHKVYHPEKNLIIDGSPRKILEAEAMDEMFKFLKIEKADVVYLDISDEEVISRIKKRETNRKDDSSDEKIKNRLEFFQTEVIPVLNYFEENSDFYNFHKINGIGKEEEIFEKIKEALNL